MQVAIEVQDEQEAEQIRAGLEREGAAAFTKCAGILYAVKDHAMRERILRALYPLFDQKYPVR